MPDHSLLLQIVVLIATAGATYGAIKSDLRALHEKVNRAQAEAEKANLRLDNHIDKG